MQGRYTEAKESYEQVLQAEPHFAPGHYNLGLVLYAQGHFDEAVAHYRKALTIDPTLIAPLNDLGVALYALGRTEEAIRCFQRAVQLKPDFSEARNNLDALLGLQTEQEAGEQRRRFIPYECSPILLKKVHPE
tara:strand:+ start:890 stop:1288 length:399 start_codon:yes stop_codon:yes gene_type:complete